MRRIAQIGFSLCWLIAAAAGHAEADTVLVLSQGAAKLSAIDTQSQTITASLTLGRSPANMVVTADQSLAYIAHSDLGKISVVDLKAWKVDRTFSVPGSPFGLCISKSGHLFVGDWNGDQILQLDAATGDVLKTARTGKAPAHLVLAANEESILTVARESNSVSVHKSNDLSKIATIPVGKAPFALAISPDASQATVANVQSGSVSLIDLKAKKVLRTIEVGGLPYGVVYLDQGRRVLVSNQQDKSVSFINLETSEAPARTKVGEYPEGVAASVKRGQAYVANWFSDTVSILDTRAQPLSVIAQIKVPTGPRAVAVIEAGPDPK